jgi:hypothetical protein
MHSSPARGACAKAETGEHDVSKRIATFLALMALPSLTLAASEQHWRFRVYLDGKPIGYHDFLLSEHNDERELQSRASFEYRMLFVKLYEYEHENTEVWHGNCLAEVASRTDADGKPYEVKGRRLDDRFVVQATAGVQELPACIMSFAYWNPAFLRQKRLLNMQNGEFTEVRVSGPEHVALARDGSVQPARRYKLEGRELDIELWYSENNEWLALEAATDGGRTLRYELL